MQVNPYDGAAELYRDSTGRRLVDYPRPSVAVDTALLTVAPTNRAPSRTGTGAGHLAVIQVRHHPGRGAAESWRLPGTFLHPGERLIDAVQRCLRDKAGITGATPAQLCVFDDPARDDRGWVLSVAHLAVARYDDVTASAGSPGVRLVPAADPGPMPYDHTAILQRAVAHLQERYAADPDPYGLLRGPFTLRDLRLIHEAIAGNRLQKDTFRRRMEQQLTPTGDVAAGAIGRPAELFHRRP